MAVSIIAAVSRNGVIGNQGKLPWRLPSDMKRFKELTTNKVVVMGRKTFESLGKKPLPNRTNIVITKHAEIADQYVFGQPSLMVVTTLSSALHLASVLATSLARHTGVEANKEIMIIGGSSIYKDCLPIANKIYLSTIEADIHGDVRFPEWNRDDWALVTQEFLTDEKGFLESTPEELNLPYKFEYFERKLSV